jgi:hypothetical protein
LCIAILIKVNLIRPVSPSAVSLLEPYTLCGVHDRPGFVIASDLFNTVLRPDANSIVYFFFYDSYSFDVVNRIFQTINEVCYGHFIRSRGS